MEENKAINLEKSSSQVDPDLAVKEGNSYPDSNYKDYLKQTYPKYIFILVFGIFMWWISNTIN